MAEKRKYIAIISPTTSPTKQQLASNSAVSSSRTESESPEQKAGVHSFELCTSIKEAAQILLESSLSSKTLRSDIPQMPPANARQCSYVVSLQGNNLIDINVDALGKWTPLRSKTEKVVVNKNTGDAILASKDGKLKQDYSLNDIDYTIHMVPMTHADAELKGKLNKRIFNWSLVKPVSSAKES